MYIGTSIHFQRGVQKGVKKWNKIIYDKTSRIKKSIVELKPKIIEDYPK
jgi:hypothetical protein